jgi:hypothetical protein
MYKSLCLAVLLVGMFALADHNSAAAPATSYTSPQIVARGKLLNLTASIPTTTLFTPRSTGLYRLSVYTTLATSDTSSGQYWSYVLGWTDDGGVETANQTLFLNTNQVPPYAWGSPGSTGLAPGSVSTFEAVAGSPVTYSFIFSGPDNSVTSLYWVLERLE